MANRWAPIVLEDAIDELLKVVVASDNRIRFCLEWEQELDPDHTEATFVKREAMIEAAVHVQKQIEALG